jgi:hypothetical protein
MRSIAIGSFVLLGTVIAACSADGASSPSGAVEGQAGGSGLEPNPPSGGAGTGDGSGGSSSTGLAGSELGGASNAGGASSTGGATNHGGTSAVGGAGGGSAGGGGSQAGAGGALVLDPCVASNTCPAGVWVQRELPGFDAPYKVETVVVDPVRPSDAYAFTGSNGGPMIKVYRSTNYGDTWEQRTTTDKFTGNPWGASIDPNPSRDPATTPTLWSPAGYGANGAWKSTDGGVTFVRSSGCDQAFGPHNPFGTLLTDLYHVKILPDDPPNHILATYHYYFKETNGVGGGEGGFGESWDGGATWVIHPPIPGSGSSHYVIPVSGTTWAIISQEAQGTTGIWRTTTAGRVGGTAAAKYRDGTISNAAWTKVDNLEHTHGSHENIVLKTGTILAAGTNTGARSTDGGATWTHFTNGVWAKPFDWQGSSMTNIGATDKFIYTNYLYNPTLARAPLADPIGADKWNHSYCETPAAMKEGGAPFGMATTYNPDTKQWVIIAGANGSGIWKYIEP